MMPIIILNSSLILFDSSNQHRASLQCTYKKGRRIIPNSGFRYLRTVHVLYLCPYGAWVHLAKRAVQLVLFVCLFVFVDTVISQMSVFTIKLQFALLSA